MVARPLARGDTLERLQQDEAALEREIADARRDAAAAIGAARREAEVVVSKARREAEGEAARLRLAATQEVDRALAEERAALDAELAHLAERSRANRSRAVDRAVALALGEES
jgi:F0F1-type ATP synthase membrane subunit b/b'